MVQKPCRVVAALFLSLIVTSIAQAQPADATAAANVDVGMDKTVQQLAALVKKSVVVVTFRGRDGERQGFLDQYGKPCTQACGRDTAMQAAIRLDLPALLLP